MAHWLIPANTQFYDVLSAFTQSTTFWPINANLSFGDTVYIYLAAPYKQIGFVCNVLNTGYGLDKISDNVTPFIKGGPERVNELISSGMGMEFNFTKKRFKEWVSIPLEFQDAYTQYITEALNYAKQKD